MTVTLFCHCDLFTRIASFIFLFKELYCVLPTGNFRGLPALDARTITAYLRGIVQGSNLGLS